MIIKMIIFITVLSYAFIVSQSFMYILSLKHAQLNLAVKSYIELRKLIDTSMRKNFRYAVYAALMSNLILVITSGTAEIGLLFVTSLIALIALMIDILITVKRSLPVNDIINCWTENEYPEGWMYYRTKWLSIFQWRQIANISGFTCLLIGVVFG